jgi:protein-tyrosine phosphatase
MGDLVDARSAGFIGPGRAPPSHAVEAALTRGLDTSEHRSRLVTPALLEEADLVVVMDAPQSRRVRRIPTRGSTPIVILGDLDPDPIPRRAIKDPWGRGHEVFESVFDRIDRCIEELSANLVETGSETHPCSSTTSP